MEPDEEVAGQLERAAVAASDRRGHVAAAAMFERAAGLTPESEPRARRLYLAAHSAWLAGQGDRALRLLDDAASAGAGDDLLRADVSHLQSRIELRRNATEGVVDRLVAEAERVEPLDAARAGAMLATAVEATPPDARLELARRAAALAAGHDDAAGLLTTLVLSRALLEAGETTEAHEHLVHARATLAANRELRCDPELILAAVETLARVGPGDDALCRELLDEVTAEARAHAVVVLPRALLQTAWLDFEAGQWTDASLNFFEAARLADEIGQERERIAAIAGNGLLDALRGRVTDARAAAEQLRTTPVERPRASSDSSSSACGDPVAAIAQLEAATADPAPPVLLRGLPAPQLDLAEAYLRVGPAGGGEGRGGGAARRRCSVGRRAARGRSGVRRSKGALSPNGRSCSRVSGSTSASISAARAHGAKPGTS